MRLTEHFTFEELTKTDVAELQNKNRKMAESLKGKLIRLAEWAEEIRSALGNVPMIVLSGYRCRYLNTRVGGACGSQHTKAEAIDFIPSGLWVREAFVRLKDSNAQFGQLILERRGGGFIIHAGMGTKRQLLYSPKAGVYENWKE